MNKKILGEKRPRGRNSEKIWEISEIGSCKEWMEKIEIRIQIRGQES